MTTTTRPSPPAAPAARPAWTATPPSGARPAPPPPMPEPAGFHVSLTEVLHLGVSLGALTVAFAFAFAHLNPRPDQLVYGVVIRDVGAWAGRALELMPQSFVLVFLGFLLHEMAHKLVAQRLDLWAEFRASAGGLFTALGLCVFTTIIFAAPGAVLIVGNATRRDGALISIAGPMTNIVIGFLFLPLVGTDPNPTEFGGLGNFWEAAVFVNALLAIFNLLPFPPLDGSKIVKWSVPVYLGMLGLAGLLFFLAASPSL